MRLSDKISKLRKQNGMSQEDLAEKLNVSRQAISRWEKGSAMPDANNILQISKLLGVTTDYLLNDDFTSDNDLPQVKNVKNDNYILHLNLTKIAIIMQVAFLNAAMRPFGATEGVNITIEGVIKIVPILLASIWMAHNLKYEKDTKQYKKNMMIELLYCGIQAVVFVFSYFSQMYYIGTTLLIVVAIVYLLLINPKFMNRPFIKKRVKKRDK